MEEPPELMEQLVNMSSPGLLNSLNFPPLKSASRPDTLIMPADSRSDEAKSGCCRGLSKKRTMIYAPEQNVDKDGLLQCSGSAGLVDSQLTSPVKKFRKSAYRDPPQVLQSLDSDSLKALFESPTLGDSQNSESSLWTPSRDTARSTCSESLNSIGDDIIQKYSTATLNSINGFELADSSTSPTSTILAAPVCSQNERTSKTQAFTLFMSTTNQNSAANVSSSSASHFISSTSTLQDNSEVRQSSSMSLSFSESYTTKQTRPLHAPVSNQPASYEKFVNLSVEKKNPNYSGKKINKTRNQIKSSPVRQDKPQSKTDNRNFNSSDDDDDDEGETNDGLSTSELYEGDPLKYQKCRKHENHSKFHSLPNLQARDLPEEIRHEDSVSFLSCLSQLVVQITVHSTSHARGTDDMYSSYIGTDRKRYGSGFIASVDEVITHHRCKREGCPHALSLEDFSSSFEDSGSTASPSFNKSVSSSSFNRSASNLSTASSSSNSSGGGRGLKHFFYGGVRIHTNKHVIFDRSEAENAYIKFFYNTPEGKEVVHGHVAAISGVNSMQDHVVLHVMSHDKSVFTTIDLCLHDAKTCYKKMLESTEKIHLIPAQKHSWVAIISHPHGLTKTITFGRIVDEVKQITRIIKYYDAPTCPGSSGGLVITPSLLRLQWPGAVHSCTDTKTGYNITFDSRFPDLDSREMRRINKTVLSQKLSYSENIFKL